MSQEGSAAMKQARFAAIVEAYGGNSQRWPQDERQAALRWLASNVSAQELVAREGRLDQAMGEPYSDAIVSTLESRLLADFDSAARNWSFAKLAHAAAETIWPGAPVWQPACALGLAFAAGLIVAAWAPLDVEQDDGAAGVFALDATPDADSGQGI